MESLLTNRWEKKVPSVKRYVVSFFLLFFFFILLMWDAKRTLAENKCVEKCYQVIWTSLYYARMYIGIEYDRERVERSR